MLSNWRNVRSNNWNRKLSQKILHLSCEIANEKSNHGRSRLQNGFFKFCINLLSNSVSYGVEGGETRIRFYDMGDNILIEIADNGIGIALEHLPRIFESFYRVDKSRSRNEGGSGLGSCNMQTHH
jgi:light-regulated signal transduction histidine kinase (bacteriophytochrome)